MKPPVGENAATTVTFKTSFQCSGSFPSAPHCVPESRWVSSAPSTRETQSSQNSFTRGILISFNHKSYTCRFANTSKTDQEWSKYSFCQVSWHNTPELQLRATVQKNARFRWTKIAFRKLSIIDQNTENRYFPSTEWRWYRNLSEPAFLSSVTLCPPHLWLYVTVICEHSQTAHYAGWLTSACSSSGQQGSSAALESLLYMVTE